MSMFKGLKIRSEVMSEWRTEQSFSKIKSIRAINEEKLMKECLVFFCNIIN